MTKHTPGKWMHEKAGSNHWVTSEAEGISIAFIGGNDSIFTQHKNTPHAANALLIAAAPEMYEALAKAVGALNNWPYKGGTDSDIEAALAYNEARSLLSRLEGSTGVTQEEKKLTRR